MKRYYSTNYELANYECRQSFVFLSALSVLVVFPPKSKISNLKFLVVLSALRVSVVFSS